MSRCMIHRDTDTYTDTGTYNDTYTQGHRHVGLQRHTGTHTHVCVHAHRYTHTTFTPLRMAWSTPVPKTSISGRFHDQTSSGNTACYNLPSTPTSAIKRLLKGNKETKTCLMIYSVIKISTPHLPCAQHCSMC